MLHKPVVVITASFMANIEAYKVEIGKIIMGQNIEMLLIAKRRLNLVHGVP